MTNLSRRRFIYQSGLGASFVLSEFWPVVPPRKKINKREVIFNLINGGRNGDYVPCGFFVHFGDGYRTGDAAVKRHLDYFQAIDMDFVKIQYEAEFPRLPKIQKPADWAQMPYYALDFYARQLYVVKELVKQGKPLAPVIATLYSPFMSAGHTAGGDVLTAHLKENPEAVKKGLDIITESTLLFARECIKLGVDGFLSSTQGGEAFRFQDAQIFNHYVKPYDLVVMREINAACACNVLHICDYVGDYDDLTPFLDYPGHIVNCSLKIAGKNKKVSDLATQFKRPFFGGLEKRGPISHKDPTGLQTAVQQVLAEAPDRFILGAECALLGEINWSQVRQVVDWAHGV